MNRRIILATLCLVLSFLIAAPARAALQIFAEEKNGNVVFTFVGSLNPGSGNVGAPFSEEYLIEPIAGDIESWQSDNVAVNRFALNAAVPFGSGGQNEVTNAGTGTDIAILGNRLYLNVNYQAGTAFTTVLTFGAETFASLEIDTMGGPYVWTITETGDTITMVFGSPPPPDSSSTSDNSALKKKLRKKLAKIQRKIRIAKRKGQAAKVKRLKRKAKKIRRRLRRL